MSSPTLPDGDSGASAVEFALVLPMLLILLFGAVTGALAYNRDVTLTHAAREGTRWAVTLAITSDPASPVPTSWFEQVADRAEAAASGDLRVGTSGRYICVAYVEVGTYLNGAGMQAERTRKYEEGEDGSGTETANDTCYDDGISGVPGESRIQVVVGRDTRIDAVFLRREISLRSEAVGRFEHESPYDVGP